MINFKVTEKDLWRNIVAQQIQDASDEYMNAPCKALPFEPELMAEPYWLSEAKPGDVFFFKDNDGNDVWQRCTVTECVHDVVFYTSQPIEHPELAPLYMGVQHMDISARANQHAFLHRAEVHIKKSNTYKYVSSCPYTRIIIDE